MAELTLRFSDDDDADDDGLFRRLASSGDDVVPDHILASLVPGAPTTMAIVSDRGQPRAAAVGVDAAGGQLVALVGDREAVEARHLAFRALLGALVPSASVTWWTNGSSDDARLASECGLAPHRRLLRMSMPLDDDVGALSRSSTEVRSFRRGDEDDLLAVNNDAFADHPEQGGWTHDTLRRRFAEPWFDEQDVLLHHRHHHGSSRLAAFCWVKMHHVRPAALVGEIYVIGVAGFAQGLGLGHELTVAGLVWMRHKGASEAMLYVDADNTRAVSLYRSLGFEVSFEQQSFRGSTPQSGQHD
jgi:mycothiol synthase